MGQAKKSMGAMIGQMMLPQFPHLPRGQVHLLVEDLLSLKMTKDVAQSFVQIEQITFTIGFAQELITVRVTLLLGLVG